MKSEAGEDTPMDGLMSCADTVFQHGKHRGKTWSFVRRNHIEYFYYLVNQPAGNVKSFFGFITYCDRFLTAQSAYVEEY